MDAQQIRAIAASVRSAILAIPAAERPPVFQNFPRGSCGWASLLLGAILKDKGSLGFLYVCGQRNSSDRSRTISHAWLARESLIVDITADQFKDAPQSVIVSIASEWHRTFELEHIEPSDFRESLGPGTYPLLAIYSTVKELLRLSQR